MPKTWRTSNLSTAQCTLQHSFKNEQNSAVEMHQEYFTKSQNHRMVGVGSDFCGSQNHRMVRVGMDLCGSSSPTPLPKQGHLEQAVQDLVQAGLEYLHRRRLHHLPGQPVPVLHHPQKEEVVPHVQKELLILQFVPVAPRPVTGHH